MGLNISLHVDPSEFLDVLLVNQLKDEGERLFRRHGSFLDEQVATDKDFMRQVKWRMDRLLKIRYAQQFAEERKLLLEVRELFEHRIGGFRTDFQYRLYPTAALIAIALSKTFTAPLSRIAILSQVSGMHYQSAALTESRFLREARRIVADEGFKSLWKGNSISVIRRMIFAGVIIAGYNGHREFLGSRMGDNEPYSGLVHLIAGGLTGIEATCITYSLDMARTRLAAQRNSIYGLRGTWHALYDLHFANGLLSRTMFRGLGVTLLGTVPSMAITFSVYESSKSFLKAGRLLDDDSPLKVGLACGSIAGLAASTATYPIDLVRRRMQLDGIAGRAPVYTGGLRSTFRSIIRKEGLRGLYRGIGPQCLRVASGHAVTFISFEMMKLSISTYETIKSSRRSR